MLALLCSDSPDRWLGVRHSSEFYSGRIPLAEGKKRGRRKAKADLETCFPTGCEPVRALPDGEPFKHPCLLWMSRTSARPRGFLPLGIG